MERPRQRYLLFCHRLEFVCGRLQCESTGEYIGRSHFLAYISWGDDSLYPFELLGMAFTTVPAYQNKGGGDLLAEVVQPLDGFATFLLVLLALSVVANNIPNDYRL